jgi:Ca-activated chloride channel homolog
MEWGQLKNLIWLWTVPAAVLLFWMSAVRRRKEIEKFGEAGLVERLFLSFSRNKRRVKRVLVLLTLVSIVAALAQPHFRKSETKVERRGVDVIIAVDVSNSMMAKDIAPTRLDKAKLELSGLIDKLKGDRIGIVAFAGDAIIQCPLTLDRGAVKLFLGTISPELVEFQGTNVGRAIGVSTQAFQKKEKDAKALILLTDGEDHEPETPRYVQQAKDAGVRIFTIGIGSAEGSTVPEGASYKRDRQGQVVISRINENFLRKISKDTGGVYYRSTRGEVEADHLAREIRQMTQKGFESEWSVEYEENYQFFVLAALLFLAAEMVLSERKKSA